MPLEGEYAPGKWERAREQAEAFEKSGGRERGTMQGYPIVLITSVGAKSGKLRKTPLIRVEHDGQYLAVASVGGAPTNPAWYWNLKQNPHVELQDGADRRDYDARELTGAERDPWWQRAVEVFPQYARYQEQTERLIPVFLLTPRD